MVAISCKISRTGYSMGFPRCSPPFDAAMPHRHCILQLCSLQDGPKLTKPLAFFAARGTSRRSCRGVPNALSIIADIPGASAALPTGFCTASASTPRRPLAACPIRLSFIRSLPRNNPHRPSLTTLRFVHSFFPLLHASFLPSPRPYLFCAFPYNCST